MKICFKILVLVAIAANCLNCGAQPAATGPRPEPEAGAEPVDEAPAAAPRPAAENLGGYLPILLDKRVGLVVNQTSRVGAAHLVDTLLASGVDVVRLFAPEHGFRGGADAGAVIQDGTDTRTGLRIVSLYGRNKKPTADQLRGLDLLVFDIQDVGARFYTYISTLHYVMESAARYGVPVLVLDRPNPNGWRTDGPLRQPGYASFVGLDPIPVLHGMTVGELAHMINGEGWLGEGLFCKLGVVPCTAYNRASSYELPVAPSPNLPNQRSVYLYPGLCFFEGTAVSIGRGTEAPFQQYGHPQLPETGYGFTPRPGPGASNPKLNGTYCHGFDLRNLPLAELRARPGLDLDALLYAYRALNERGVDFFTRPDFFDLLAGTDQLRRDILAGKPAAEIRAGWAEELAAFRELRRPYLLYE